MDGASSDGEKNTPAVLRIDVDSSSGETPESPQGPTKRGFLDKLRSFEDALDRKLGIEVHSIERRLPEDRDPFYARWINQIGLVGFWIGGSMNLTCFASGFLGWELGLDLRQSLLIIVFGTVVGGSVTSWCATMGPPTGLRQVSICRYSLGWYPAKVIAIFNTIQQIGWCTCGSITGGQALSAFSDGKVGTALGVVLCSLASLVFSFVGLTAIYRYMKFVWLAFLICFLIILGETARFGDLTTPPSTSGTTGSGVALTFFCIVYGLSACCAGFVADFYVEYPANIPKVKVFLLTFSGLFISTCLSTGCGAVVASALSNNDEWNEQYEAGIGFLIQAIVYPHGLAKLILFLLLFAGIGMNCAAMYSASLSIQQSSRTLAVVPRFIWTLVCFAAIIGLGLADSDQLLVFLESFLGFLGYYATAIFVCLVTEHFVLRHGSFDNYDLEAWNKPERLPVGYAGGFAFICGIVGAVLGMATTWYTGVVAKLIGDFGGDVGNELCFLFTLAAYIPARFLEKKLVGR
ncbi:hypothetical protein AAE478_007130 [Parahypoxylon ruwenzoriense]